MVIENSIVKVVRDHVLEELRKYLPDEMTYHSIHHTQEVVHCANEIAQKQNLTEDELEILNVAAWFHDVGYIKSSEEHEKWGAKMAREFLGSIEYPGDKIEQVEGCILATQMPQNPKNNIEQIICDADLMHLADKDYFQKADLLHKEIEKTKLCTIPEKEWMQMNQEFLNSHCFFTEYAQKTYEAAVKENLKKVRERLKKWQKAKK